jgi:NAD(P)H-hydrate epimerase
MSVSALGRSQLREIDRRAIEEYGLTEAVLMENAGRGAAELLVDLGIGGLVVICAGKGNNGGDGFVIARHLENRGHRVKVLLFCEPDELRGSAAANYRALDVAGTPLARLGGAPGRADIDREFSGADWIVDALLGTGAVGKAREPFATAIDRINASSAKVLAVDLPSGMDCDTGEALGACVRAHHTAAFVAPKLGFGNSASVQWTGAVHVIDIGAPKKLVESCRQLE